jgi:hypothetical protein
MILKKDDIMQKGDIYHYIYYKCIVDGWEGQPVKNLAGCDKPDMYIFVERPDPVMDDADDAQDRCTKWCNVAMDMINELRQDYAPGELGELDGVKAILKLRKRVHILQEALEEVQLDLEMQATLNLNEGNPQHGYHLRDLANKARTALEATR